MIDNIIIKDVYNITIENYIDGMKCVIKIDSLTSPTLSLSSEGFDEYDIHNHTFNKKTANWREMFADGTRFLIDGEFEDLNDKKTFYGVYDMITNTFVPRDRWGR